MNSKDEYKDWDKFIDYTKILDQDAILIYLMFIPNQNYIGNK